MSLADWWRPGAVRPNYRLDRTGGAGGFGQVRWVDDLLQQDAADEPWLEWRLGADLRVGRRQQATSAIFWNIHNKKEEKLRSSPAVPL